MSSDIPINQFAGFGVHGDGSGAVDEAIGYDGLAVDAGEGLWCLRGQDCGFTRHVYFVL